MYKSESNTGILGQTLAGSGVLLGRHKGKVKESGTGVVSSSSRSKRGGVHP